VRTKRDRKAVISDLSIIALRRGVQGALLSAVRRDQVMSTFMVLELQGILDPFIMTRIPAPGSSLEVFHPSHSITLISAVKSCTPA
jgi:hypothetical protein